MSVKHPVRDPSRADAVYAQLKRDIVNSNNEQDRRYRMRRIDDLENAIRNLYLDSDSAQRELNLFTNDYRVVEDKHYRMGYLK